MPFAVGVQRANDGHPGGGGLNGVVMPHLAGHVKLDFLGQCIVEQIAAGAGTHRRPRDLARLRPGDQ